MTRAIIQPRRSDNAEQPPRKGRLIITIDGPAGAGKSTVARLLASSLGYLYLDTGALYRAVAWKIQASGVDPADEKGIAATLRCTRVRTEQRADRMHVYVDAQDLTDEIRRPEISRIASMVSALPSVRDWLLPVQRQAGSGGGVVAEGRDVGTRVFPSADVKFFLEADMEVRAARRHRELTAAGYAVPVDQTLQDLRDRDTQDRTREVAPLLPAPDAERIDTSALTIAQVIERMMAVISSRL